MFQEKNYTYIHTLANCHQRTHNKQLVSFLHLFYDSAKDKWIGTLKIIIAVSYFMKMANELRQKMSVYTFTLQPNSSGNGDV